MRAIDNALGTGPAHAGCRSASRGPTSVRTSWTRCSGTLGPGAAEGAALGTDQPHVHLHRGLAGAGAARQRRGRPRLARAERGDADDAPDHGALLHGSASARMVAMGPSCCAWAGSSSSRAGARGMMYQWGSLRVDGSSFKPGGRLHPTTPLREPSPPRWPGSDPHRDRGSAEPPGRLNRGDDDGHCRATQREKLEVRRQIRRRPAALRTRGWNNVTMRIADAIEYNPTTIYLHRGQARSSALCLEDMGRMLALFAGVPPPRPGGDDPPDRASTPASPRTRTTTASCS